MMRFNAILTRVVKELLRDKRTLALMLLAPVLVLTLMYFVFDTNSETHLKIGVDGSVPSEIVKTFPAKEVKIEHFSDHKKIKEKIADHDLDAFITLEGTNFQVSYENEDPSSTAKAKALFANVLTADKMKAMKTALQKTAQATGQKPQIQNFSVTNHYMYGTADSTFFDKIFPVLIGFFVFFFVFLISGIALLRERTSGTLERLLATPVKRSEIVFGYLTGYGIFAVIQTLIIIFYSIFILDLHVEGSLLWVIVSNIMIALVALSMGIFVSTFANSEFQMIQFIPIVVVPQIFFADLIPLDAMNDWIQKIAYLFPLSYGGKILTDVMIKGQGFAVIWPGLGVLLLFVAVFTWLNIIGMKRYRKV